MRSLTAVLTAALVLLPAAPAWAANQPPVAVDDAVIYRNDGGDYFPVNALVNDSDPDGDPLTYTAVTPASKGNAYLQAGKLYYHPYFLNEGTDSFTYTVTDGQGNTATGTVTATLWVDPVLPAGVAISSAAPGSATLTWSAAARATEYRVYRNGVLVASTPDLSWTDTALPNSGDYRYQISSVNGGGYENLVWQVMAPAVYRRAQLPTPTGLTVDVTDVPTTLSLDWDGTGTGPWKVFRDGVLVASPTASQFLDTGLVTGREYSYQVQIAWPSTATAIYPESALSAAVRGTPVALSAIGRLFWDLGWTGGTMGAVTVPERAVPGGRQQDHARGIIVQQDGEDPVSVRTDFATAYAAVGGATGDLGFPLFEAECNLRGHGCGQFFEDGSIWYQQATGTHAVRLDIEDAWAATGWEDGPLGYPAGDQAALAGGVWQAFEDGGVYWGAGTGAIGVSGEMHDAYAAQSGPAGPLGYPTTEADCDLRDGGCSQAFQGGYLNWSPTTGAQITTGGILAAWERQGREDGVLGYPTTGANCTLRDGGCWQGFQGGYVHWSHLTGAHVTTGGILAAWAGSGWENGVLGYPTTDATCGIRGGGCWQGFQGGYVHWSPSSGAQVTTGGILAAWAGSGWQNGVLGYPTTGATCGIRGGGCWQAFQGGYIHWSPTSGAQITAGGILNTWAAQGWQNGPLGYPTTGATCGLRNGGCWQAFQGGYIFWSPGTGAQVVSGAILSAWGRQGWQSGRLGYPTGGATVSRGVTRQTFQGGSITIDARGRVTVR